MSDCKEKLLTEFEVSLQSLLPSAQISMVSDSLTRILSRYDVIEMERGMTPYEPVNERILKRYCGCLFVDGKSNGTIAQYKRTCLKLAEATGKTFPEIGVYDIRFFSCE